MKILKKVNALVKYETINLRRGILIWSIIVLYVFGWQQVIGSMFSAGHLFLSLDGVVSTSWLPLNLIMIPLLLLNMKIGESENDIFKTLDISSFETYLSKVFISSTIGIIIFAANIIVAVVVSLLCKVSMDYFLVLMLGYTVNTLIFLIITSALGLFLGQVISKYLGSVLTFIVLLMLFGIISNFYKISNVVLPLINIRNFTSSIDIITYDKSYIYHNIFWILIGFVCSIFTYCKIWRREKTLSFYILPVAISIISVWVCVYLGVNINEMKPDYYDIISRRDAEYTNYSNTNATFFCDENIGFRVDEYDMNINIDSMLENTCDMKISITKDAVTSLKMGLYKGLDISKLSIDGKTIDFKRTNNNFEAILEREYKAGQTINMKIVYSGKINTKWEQGEELFYARMDGIFLADVFEWYPKLNDSIVKDYTVNVKYNSKNKIYSNMEESINGYEYTFKGQDREIFLMSSPLIIERNYKDYLLVGNEELVNSDRKCDDLIFRMTKGNESEINIKKLIFAPFIAGGGKIDKGYIKMYLGANY